jgi:acyl transferase domain-containing protein/NADPH:quinone reductase-like Zn-dependent oxidoreductase/acyl carrier protein
MAEHDATGGLSGEVRDLLLRQRARVKALEAQVSELSQAAAEPIAIVGMGCRFPAGANTPDAFWTLLSNGVDATGEVPADRFDVNAVYSADTDAAGKIYTRRGAFLREDVAAFDADFFGISPREAAAMDPQQRLLLEVAWETFEHCGLPVDRAKRRRIGVYVGCMTQDYASLSTGQGDQRRISAYTGTGTGNCFLAGRLAFALGLGGPAMTIDTACSSSLVALHLAAQALRGGECDAALAGGVNLILTADVSVFLCRAHALAPDGRCKTFDASADGYGRAEGCGLVLLKRLSDAIADGDQVLAVLLGSAINHDGASAGLTVPNPAAQEEVLRDALTASRVAAADIDYIEAHGTGTQLGDPIEIRAISHVFADRKAGRKLLVGSVKSQVGHMEAAAGISALLKVVLSLRHDAIPPQIHFDQPSPHIPWDQLPLAVPQTLLPWQPGARRRIAGISSFGLSGTNAHVVVAEAPPEAVGQCPAASPAQVITLSARSQAALTALASSFADCLARTDEQDFADICWTANSGRTRHGHRLAVAAASPAEMAARLRGHANGQPAVLLHTGQVSALPPKAAMMFAGQGAQHIGMGRELYKWASDFRQMLDRCEAVCLAVRGESLLGICFTDPDGRLGRTEWSQPALYAFELALAKQWQAWGLECETVIGHSVGEFAAAALAGVFSPEDGMRLVCTRASLMQRAPAGAMCSVAIDEARAREWLSLDASLAIAAVNSENQLVFAGSAAAIAAVEARAHHGSFRSRRLDVRHGFHSPAMDAICDEFQAAVEAVERRAPQLDVISTLTGRLAGNMLTSSEYWRTQLRQTVRFRDGICALLDHDDELGVLLEISPQASLAAAAASCASRPVRVISALRKGEQEVLEICSAAAELFTAGIDLAWPAWPARGRRVALPSYPFERQRHWLATAPRPAGEPPISDLLHRFEWLPLAMPLRAPETPGAWLLIGGGEAAPALINALRAAGQVAEHALLTADGHVANVECLIDEGWARIVHLGAFDADARLAEDGDLEAAWQVGVGSLHELAARFAGRTDAAMPRLWCIGPQAWDVGAPDPHIRPLSAAIQGFAASVAIEYPDYRCISIDVGDDWHPGLLAALLLSDTTETRIALRGKQLFCPRVVAGCSPAASSGGPLADQPGRGAWLITGGLGGLGMAAAEWLAAQGVRELVLLARRPPDSATQARLTKLRDQSVTVHLRSVDVADRAALGQCLSELRAAGVVVRGVIHAAGVLADRTLLAMTREDVRSAMAAKALGAWNLVELLGDHPLEACVFYGSIAGVIGAPGQANYAAANAFLDALAFTQRHAGRPALSIDWGPIAQVGMAAVNARGRPLAALGLLSVDVSESLRALGVLLADTSHPHWIVARVDQAKFATTAAAAGLSQTFEAWTRNAGPSPPADIARNWVGRLLSLPAVHRPAVLTAMLQAELAAILGFDDASAIDPGRGFQSLGMDSLGALELRNRLARQLDISLPATLAFETPTVGGLADYILTELKLAETQAPSQSRPAASNVPIAITGVSCRFPGAANLAAYWTLLREGRDQITEVPASRWDAAAWFDPDPATPNRTNARHGGFLDSIDGFDAGLFRISPREAQAMDPQQHLLLETAWEALEQALIAPDSLRDTATGVFIGIGISDFATLQVSDPAAQVQMHTGTGTGLCFGAGRLSHTLGLRGPSMSIDTACSSSLVALHLACQSLRAGECTTALAGGVHLMLSPHLWVYLSKVGALSPSGRCATFDAAADGYVRGEGAAMLVLKRLDDALAQGDPVFGVIHGSAVNHDGASGGLTVPSGPAQAELIAAALGAASVQPHEVGYVEAHGTGTPLGDPIELRALGQVFGGRRADDAKLLIGSVKTNIGHLEAASGLAGLVKVVLSLAHRQIPPTLHFRNPTPHIDWAGLPLEVPTETLEWPVDRPYAGISSFGLSGTNAHVIVGPAPQMPEPNDLVANAEPGATTTEPPPASVLCLSANGRAALAELAGEYARCLSESAAPTSDISHSALMARARLSHRLAMVVRPGDGGREQAAAALRSFAGAPRSGDAGGSQGSIHISEPATRKPPSVVMLFSGQGAQVAGMGAGLFAAEPRFRDILQRCEAVVLAARGTSLLEVMFAPIAETKLSGTLWTQPALYAFEVALAGLWIARGVHPTVLLGHSVGEIAAASVAGVMSVEDGMTLVCARAAAMDALPSDGGMTALAATREDVDAILGACGMHEQVSIAGINAPTQIVCAGSLSALAIVEATARDLGVAVRRLDVSHPFHSPLMRPALAEIERVAASISMQPPRIPIVSNLTAQLADARMATASYWREQAIAPVRFSESLLCVQNLQVGVDALLEVGPRPTLLQPTAECLPNHAGSLIASCRGKSDETLDLADAAARLFCVGVDFAGKADPAEALARRVPIPIYPFQRERFALTSGSITPAAAGHATSVHPWLGTRVHVAGYAAVFEQAIHSTALDWVDQHRVQGAAIVPAAFFLAAAHEAGAQVLGREQLLAVDNLAIGVPLARAASAAQLQILVRRQSDTLSVRFCSRPADGPDWTEHAQAELRIDAAEPMRRLDASDTPTAIDADLLYAAFAERGLAYGELFRGIRSLSGGNGFASADVQTRLPAGWTAGLAPTWIDAVLQSLAGSFDADDRSQGWLPVGVQRMRRFADVAASEICVARARLRPAARAGSGSRRGRVGDIEVRTPSGAPVLWLEGVQLQPLAERPVQRSTPGALNHRDSDIYRIGWRKLAPIAPVSLAGEWLLIGAADVAQSLRGLLNSAGAGCHIIDDPAVTTLPVVPRGGWRGVIYIAPLDDGGPHEPMAALERVCRPGLEWVQRLLRSGSQGGRLWLVTCGAMSETPSAVGVLHAALWGLANAIAWEHPDLRCTRIDLEPVGCDARADQLFNLLSAPASEDQLSMRAAECHVARLTAQGAANAQPLPGVASDGRLAIPPDDNYRLAPSETGRLDALMLQPRERRTPSAGEIEVQVEASGLNFRDVLVALGLYPGPRQALGGECAGIVTRLGPGVSEPNVGTRVVALTNDAFSRYVVVPADAAVPLPDGWSVTAAAGMPIAWLTAWHGLMELGHLHHGERVLIHAGAGGVGHAAIAIARAAGAEIWATASRPKWAALQRLGVSRVFDSRDPAGLQAARADGACVDVVLNALVGPFIEASLALLRPGGRFIELGKADPRDPLAVAQTWPGTTYTAFDLADLPAVELRAKLAAVLTAVRPEAMHATPVSVHPLSHAVDVFRAMAQGQHVGKLVFEHPAGDTAALIRGDRSYLITGGSGALGMQIARRLIAEGAGEIVLLSRGQVASDELPEPGGSSTRVRAASADVASRAQLAAVLDQLREDGLPLAGVFHLAGVLDDGVFAALSWPRVQSVMAPKLLGTMNLLELTEGTALDFTVLFSSATAVLGGAGQANYAAANAVMAAAGARAAAHGRNVLCVDWGPWAEHGMAERTPGAAGQRWARLGIERIDPQHALDQLWAGLQARAGRFCVLPVKWPQLVAALGQTPPLLQEIVAQPAHQLKLSAGQSAQWRRIAAAPPTERLAAAIAALQNIAGEVLHQPDAEAISPGQPLRDLGLDSLMAVELRNHIVSATEVVLPMTALFDYPTLADLARHILERLEPGTDGAAPEPVSRVTDHGAEPIAIVGMALRLPGAADTPQALFEMLDAGQDAVQEVPSSRWNLEQWFDSDPAAPGKMHTRWMGSIADIDRFDAGFFGIAPREARSMDPQQRLLLDLAAEALEHGGIPVHGLAGSRTGVFVGIATHDYGVRHVFARGPAEIDAWAGTGNALSAAAGRLSYVFGLEGPAMSIDTACSSSLVAVHLAVRSLRSGESDLALAGGVNLCLAPETTVFFCKLGAMAKDGRCKTFDASADGYVRGEGCAVVVLKRLSDALRDGDPIWGVVRGTAVNQDGRSNGLTAPNGAAQQDVVRRALQDAGLEPGDIGYVEAHGTGTPLGDAVELNALAQVFDTSHRADPLYVGSIKSNVGHLEAAAGLAGLIKTVLAINHGRILPNLHFSQPNQHVDWSGLAVPTRSLPWPGFDRVRRAAVSSFGFTGTNANVIVEQPPAAAPAATDHSARPLLLPVSARSPQALQMMREQLAEAFEQADEAAAPAMCWTAGARRSHYEYRSAAVAADAAGLARALRDKPGSGGAAARERHPIFVFPGQGGQWRGMGRRLHANNPVFREAFAQADLATGTWLDVSLEDALLNDLPWSRLEVIQPLLFAVQLGLAAAWTHAGVRPACVIGYSMGEVAAACFAGALRLEDAARIIVLRSRLAARVAGKGRMLTVSASSERIDQLLTRIDAGICVAARNASGSVLLSGDRDPVVALHARLRADGMFAELVDVDFASHSHHVDPVLDELEAGLIGVQTNDPRIPMRSTVTCELISAGLGPEYWRRNMREPVRFQQALAQELAAGRNAIVEVSPHPILLPQIEQDLDLLDRLDEVSVIASLRRTRGDETLQLLGAMGQLYAAGADLDWTALAGMRFPVAALPPTAQDRKVHWIEAPEAVAASAAQITDGWTRLDHAGGDALFEGRLPDGEWDGHTFVVAALGDLAQRVTGPGAVRLGDVTVDQQLQRAPANSRLQCLVRGAGTANAAIEMFVHTGEGWESRGHACLAPEALDATKYAIQSVPPAGLVRWDREAAQLALRRRGVAAELVDTVDEVWVGAGQLQLTISSPERTWSETAWSIVAVCLAAQLLGHDDPWSVPAAIRSLTVSGLPVPTGRLQVIMARDPDGALDARVHDESGASTLLVAGLKSRPSDATARSVAAPRVAASLMTQITWPTLPPPRPQPDHGTWLVSDDGAGIGAAIAARLRELGRVATLMPATVGPDEVRRMAASLTAENPLAGMAFTTAVDPATEPGSAAFAVHLVGCFGALDNASTLQSQGFHCITRNARSACPDAAQAGLWGLGRVLSLERPDRWGKLIDIAGDPDITLLVDTLLATDAEDELRVEKATRGVARLVPFAGTGAGGAWEGRDFTSGPVLITGGLGHLGRKLATWLVARGARHIVLASRRCADGVLGFDAWATGLSSKDVLIEAVALDVGQAPALQGLLDSYVARAVPIRTAFHLAGVSTPKTTDALGCEDFAEAMHGKVSGAQALIEAMADDARNAVVLFSSGAATWGSVGMGAYALANSRLDALACAARHQGRQVTSVAWGRFAAGGLVSAELERWLEQLGVHRLHEDAAFAAMDYAITQPAAAVVIADVDWATLAEARNARRVRPLLSTLVASPAPPPVSTVSGWLQSLRDLPEAVVLERIEQQLIQHLAEVLGADAQDIDSERGFVEMGMNSLMAVELARRLSDLAGRRLPATLAFENPTIRQLADALVREVLGEPTAPPPPASPDDALTAGLAQMDERQLAAALAERLQAANI